MLEIKKINSKLDYDVVITGAGPAGSTTAYLLAKNGIKTLIIDKENFPRSKLCGGLLSGKTINIIKRIYDKTDGTLLKKELFSYSSNNYKIFFKTKLIVDEDMKKGSLFFVDRKNFDYFLLNEAREIGAEVLMEEEVNEVDFANNLIITSKGNAIHGKFIIGADGVYSLIRKKVFMFQAEDNKSWTKNLAIALQLEVPCSELKKGSIIHSICNSTSLFFDFIKYGYSWVFPNKDFIKIGLGGLQNKNKLDIFTLLSRFMSFLGVEPALIKSVKGYSVPLGNYLSEPIKKGFILIGDAAGFVDPLTGEGIYYALKSAELASNCILEIMKNGSERTLEDLYLTSLRKEIFPEFESALELRNIVFEKLKYIPVNLSTSILKQHNHVLLELVSGERSYGDFLKTSKNKTLLWKIIQKK